MEAYAHTYMQKKIGDHRIHVYKASHTMHESLEETCSFFSDNLSHSC